MSSFTVNSGNQNITSLFSSLPTASGPLGNLSATIAGLTTDYSSIRNGSYGKVTRAFYSKQSAEIDEEVKKNSDKKAGKEKASSNSSEYDRIATKATKLESSISVLAKNSLYTESDYDASDVLDKVSKFVDSFNSTMNNALSSSSMGVRGKAFKLASLATANEDALKNVGISINEKDNTLSINSEKFKAASVSDVRALFGKGSSFASNADTYAAGIATAATSENSTYTKNAMFGGSSSVGNMFDSLY